MIERYESITIEEINEAAKIPFNGHVIARNLTGYSSIEKCSLCVSSKLLSVGNHYCESCIWKTHKNYECTEHETYDNIKCYKNSEELLSTFKARAAYMREHLKRLNYD